MFDILLTLICCAATALVAAVVGDNIRLRRRLRERRVVEAVERLGRREGRDG